MKSLTQVAFCFLLYSKPDHLELWEQFFSQDVHRTGVIFSHVKQIDASTPNWIKKASVKTIPTAWCSESLIFACCEMLKKAILNKNIKYFIFLSGADIPLYNYEETYKKILSTDKSRVYYMKEYENIFEKRGDIYNMHQWCILNRRCAKDYIRLSNDDDSDNCDKKAVAFINKFRELYKENGVHMQRDKDVVVERNNTWVGSCPDEVYPINWFVQLYGNDKSEKFKKYIKLSQPTYSYWDFDKDPLHPKIFDLKSAKKFKHEICGKNHIFARKFTEDSAKWIGMNCGKGYLKSPPIVTVKKSLTGRLGNQFFQYASSLGIAHAKSIKEGKKVDVCIINNEFGDELRKESEDMICVCEGPFDVCSNTDYFFTQIGECGYAIYDMSKFLEVSGSIEIESDMDHGFLQSYKYFQDIPDLVRQKLKFKSNIRKIGKNYMKSLKESENKIIGIHVRRGDQLELGTLRFPSLSYFNKAKEHFKKLYKNYDVKFIVATNDRKWVKENLLDKDTELISVSKNPQEDMDILSRCDAVVISVGTFSWWCGWLCQGPVIYYKYEFNMVRNKGEVKKHDYYPREWTPLA